MSENLIKAAKDAYKRLSKEPNHKVAAAVLCNDGKIYTGINVHHYTGGVCGEVSAFISAYNDNNRDIKMVAAVGLDSNGKPEVMNPCGKCRQFFHDYSPETKFLINDNGKIVEKNPSELLPFDWFNERYRTEG